jgi:predicted RNase H-like HicB family nuclease
MSKVRADDPEAATVTITRDGEWYVARDDTSGIASQGKTRPEALANLADALRLHAEPDDVEADEPDVPWL